VVRLEGDKAAKRVERWQEIAVEACKQCRRNVVPEIRPITDFARLWSELEGQKAIMLYENEEAFRLGDYLKQQEVSPNNEREIFLLVGPEGGFSPEEVALARRHGCSTATLGPRILRTETAGIAAASIILYHLGDLG
jgi:16S rRNA (uracil1498-N3)-methyltransferase